MDNTAKSVPSKILHVLRKDGIGGLVKKLFRRFIYKRQNLVFMGYDLTTPEKKFKQPTRYSLREITILDIDRFDRHLKKYKDDYRDLFGVGCIAFGALDENDEHLIAVVCSTDKDFYDQHYQKCFFPVKPGQIYQFAGEAAPSFRRSSITAHVPMLMWRYWRERGKTETFCTVDVENEQSIRYHAHFSFYEMGEMITTHRLLGIKWSTRASYEGEKFHKYKKKKKTVST